MKPRAKMSRRTSDPDEALSPVVGEMLMIVLAILLVSLFSLSLTGLLPSGRDYTIDIAHNESADGTIYLWHKGGDWVEKSKLEVLIIRDQGKTTTTISSADQRFILCSDEACQTVSGRTFDLGDYIKINSVTISKGDVIRLVSSRNVIFSGTADPE
ncbi:MAG: type IV pilin N-terminal domain-containing protein [Methanoregula sp.]|nr:type IV pilin N-terminal domain-containing protein [Methanoregula sp.]